MNTKSKTVIKTVQLPVGLAAEIDAVIAAKCEYLGESKAWDFSKFARQAFRLAIDESKGEAKNEH